MEAPNIERITNKELKEIFTCDGKLKYISKDISWFKKYKNCKCTKKLLSKFKIRNEPKKLVKVSSLEESKFKYVSKPVNFLRILFDFIRKINFKTIINK
jgi:hypothetical protein